MKKQNAVGSYPSSGQKRSPPRPPPVSARHMVPFLALCFPCALKPASPRGGPGRAYAPSLLCRDGAASVAGTRSSRPAAHSAPLTLPAPPPSPLSCLRPSAHPPRRAHRAAPRRAASTSGCVLLGMGGCESNGGMEAKFHDEAAQLVGNVRTRLPRGRRGGSRPP